MFIKGINRCSSSIFINNSIMLVPQKINCESMSNLTAEISIPFSNKRFSWAELSLFSNPEFPIYACCQNSKPWQMTKQEKDRGSTLTIITHTSPANSSSR
jgi:hypothetical protein